MNIYVTRDEKNYGPYTLEQVAIYVRDGALSPLDRAWQPGMEGWRRLGELLSSAPEAVQPHVSSPLPPAAPVPPFVPGRLDIREALTFPFRGSRGLARIWWMPFATLIPVFASMLLRGWRLDLIRRVSREDPEPLPDVRDTGRFLANGAVLLVMAFLYNLPLTVFVLVFGFGKIAAALDVFWWALQNLFTEGAGTFWAIVGGLVMELLVESIAPILFLVAVYPLYRMAVIRFALSGELRCFFQVFRNLRLCFRLMPEIFLVFFVDFIALRLLRWTARALITFGVGVVIAPLTTALYFWTTGHLFGQVAARVAQLDGKGGNGFGRP